MKKAVGLFFITSFFTQQAYTNQDNQVLIVGGGNAIEHSQISILKNTQWVEKKLLLKNDHQLRLAFTHGASDLPDAYFNKPLTQMSVEEIKEYIQSGDLPKTTVSSQFSLPHTNATSENVLKLIKETPKTKQLFFIFQGHGLKGKDSILFNDNYLSLWNNSELSVRNLDSSLVNSKIDSFRYVLPQCFSGSFQNLIYQDLTPGKNLVSPQRCGFTSQLPFLLSEGCTPDVNEANYRDYSTYFFEALFSSSRSGDQLLEDPDFNNDGITTPYEAHLYTLRNAVSMDFSKSSSEYYLENWSQPFYQWLPARYDTNNNYFKIAKKLASQFSGNTLVPAERNRNLKELGKHQANSESLEKSKFIKLETVRKDLLKKIESAEYSNQDKKIQNLIDQSSILTLYEDWKQQGIRSRNLKRSMVQLQKIESMLNLARIGSLFEKHASDLHKQEYQNLLQCENMPL